MATLAEIRAKLQKIDNKNSNTNNFGDNYPFWNIPNDSKAKLRFLPDADQDNTFFWVEKQMIRLSFPGIKGDDENKTVSIDVPCVETWGETCPILTETRPWWNDEGLKDMARKYWKKRSYIFQGFVQESPITEDNVPENPIRKFVISPQIFKIIKSSLLDPDFENLPSDYVNGSDFIINKTQKGDYADYSTSTWARKETALTEEQLDAVDEHKLKDLSSYLPKKPDAEALNAIFEMFEASVAGELYDPSKWAKYYRPYGFEYSGPKHNSGSSTPANESKPAPASKPAEPKVTVQKTDTDVPFEEDKPTETPTESASPAESDTSGKSAQDILAMIRNRK